MKFPFLIVSAIFLLYLTACCSQSNAKRGAPKDVSNIHYGSIILMRSRMNYISALDSSTKKVLWEKKIYKVWYCGGLETDVQDVWIDSMSLDKGKLLIRNEEGNYYTLDLKSLNVRKL